ncbi:MAG: N-acetylmuramoyl-L-alanine amidase [Leptolyngbyaceae cyanobacterium RM2_2_4]|nr:N-acetylmuramoyl-L-alanine amidase [Leptolyngbyaceae cyanobacterium SM1_4_3]NJO51067.1 N-acetylmuramoyl-L-alanine amidase [Leptolyngbyaceae cyanobacterium RM2_2_4]
MRFERLIPSLLGIVGALMIASPAEAARLQFWRFNPSQNQLVFTTDSDVQPRAQLIANPTRLVIDLPGTTLGNANLSQLVGGGVREVRVGQFDAQTARIVIELDPGYTLDPQQVQVRGATPTQWTVQLPTPERVESPPSAPPPSPSEPAPQADSPPVSGAATLLENVRVTPDGFFMRTSGATPEIEVDRSRNRREIYFDLENTAISPQLASEIPVERFGVERVQISQLESDPPIARVTLELSDPDIDWEATASEFGGIVLIPTSGFAREDEPPVSVAPPTAQAPPAEPATIEGIELRSDSAQLLIQSSQPITYTSGWDRTTADYQITIPNARLANTVTSPQLGANSPLRRVRLRQEDNDTVVILVQPAAGVNISGVNQPSQQLLSLQLQQAGQRPTGGNPIPVAPPSAGYPSDNLPGVPNSRIVVVIDPGHGGPDPGAIGINGIREKDIVLPISLEVASLLEQQGVQVVLTRQDDRDLDLEPRVQIAERANANLFVSIHANAISMSRPDVNGIETYYYSNDGLRLAQVIHASVVQNTGSPDRGVRQARFYVIRNTSMPAVLVETGFVTGRDDAPRLADPAYRSQLAGAIARGILLYVQQNF